MHELQNPHPCLPRTMREGKTYHSVLIHAQNDKGVGKHSVAANYSIESYVKNIIPFVLLMVLILKLYFLRVR